MSQESRIQVESQSEKLNFLLETIKNMGGATAEQKLAIIEALTQVPTIESPTLQAIQSELESTRSEVNTHKEPESIEEPPYAYRFNATFDFTNAPTIGKVKFGIEDTSQINDRRSGRDCAYQYTVTSRGSLIFDRSSREITSSLGEYTTEPLYRSGLYELKDENGKIINFRSPSFNKDAFNYTITQRAVLNSEHKSMETIGTILATPK